jgi:hypothetical protein
MPAYFAYGIALVSTFPLPVHRPGGVALPGVIAELVPREELLGAWSGSEREPVLTTTMSDGVRLTVASGTGGDHLVRYGERGLFLISAATDRLSCSRSVAADDPGWHRVLLDWVMYFIASLRGTQALHASSVVIDGRVSAFCALSGGGKTSVVLELVHQGAQMMSDDVLGLERQGNVVYGLPGAPFLNVIAAGSGLIHPSDVIGTIGDEQWGHATQAASIPTPMGAVFLLDRSDRYATLQLADCSLFDLRQHAVGLPHLVGAELARFTLLGDLMCEGHVGRIEAPMHARPRDIAELAREVSETPACLAGATS